MPKGRSPKSQTNRTTTSASRQQGAQYQQGYLTNQIVAGIAQGVTAGVIQGFGSSGTGWQRGASTTGLKRGRRPQAAAQQKAMHA